MFPNLPDNLESRDVIAAMREQLSKAQELHILLARVPERKGLTPVGFVTAATNGWLMWPKAFWFPWASLRNKLETSLLFLTTTRKVRQIVLYTAKNSPDIPISGKRSKRVVTEWSFLTRLAEYSVLRRVGTNYSRFGEGKNGCEFETIRRK